MIETKKETPYHKVASRIAGKQSTNTRLLTPSVSKRLRDDVNSIEAIDKLDFTTQVSLQAPKVKYSPIGGLRSGEGQVVIYEVTVSKPDIELVKEKVYAAVEQVKEMDTPEEIMGALVRGGAPVRSRILNGPIEEMNFNSVFSKDSEYDHLENGSGIISQRENAVLFAQNLNAPVMDLQALSEEQRKSLETYKNSPGFQIALQVDSSAESSPNLGNNGNGQYMSVSQASQDLKTQNFTPGKRLASRTVKDNTIKVIGLKVEGNFTPIGETKTVLEQIKDLYLPSQKQASITQSPEGMLHAPQASKQFMSLEEALKESLKDLS